MPLDPSKKATAVAALRSGEYTQNRGCIGDYENKHLCCIGVMDHALGPGIIYVPTTHSASIRLGLTHDEENELVAMNDDDGKSFDEIADWVEANL